MHPSRAREQGPPAPQQDHSPARSGRPLLDRPLRCAHYISNVRLSTGGPMRVVVDLCATLAARGHDIGLFTCDATDVPVGWTAADPRTPRVTTLDKLNRFTKLLPRRSVARLESVLPDFDVLHLHGPWETANVQFARIARRIKLPYVIMVHGTLDDWSMAQQRLKKRLYLQLA